MESGEKKQNCAKPPYSNSRFDRDRPAACHGHLLAEREKKKGRKERSRLRDGEITFLFIVIVGALNLNEDQETVG